MAKNRGGARVEPAPPPPFPPAPAVATEEPAAWSARDVPTRWLLALLVELSLAGPVRVQGTAAELLTTITGQLEAGRRAEERRGQQQLAGVLTAPVYPALPRWRTRGEAAARRRGAA